MSDVINYVIQTSKSVTMEMMDVDMPDRDTIRASRRTLRGAVGTPGGADIPSVFVVCFHFLKALTKDNLTVQRRYVLNCSFSLSANDCSNCEWSSII